MTPDKWTMLVFACFVLAVWIYFIVDRIRYRLRARRLTRPRPQGFEVTPLPPPTIPPR